MKEQDYFPYLEHYFPKTMQADVQSTLAAFHPLRTTGSLPSDAVPPYSASELPQQLRLKDPTSAFVLSFLLGSLGIDRLYVGDYVLALVKFITIGGFGIWWFVDLLQIRALVRRRNYFLLRSLLPEANGAG